MKKNTETPKATKAAKVKKAEKVVKEPKVKKVKEDTPEEIKAKQFFVDTSSMTNESAAEALSKLNESFKKEEVAIDNIPTIQEAIDRIEKRVFTGERKNSESEDSNDFAKKAKHNLESGTVNTKQEMPVVNSMTGEIDPRFSIADLSKNASREKTTSKPGELSYQAKKWADYLNYLKWTPEDFLVKYPNHKFKEFIQEVIDFNKNA